MMTTWRRKGTSLIHFSEPARVLQVAPKAAIQSSVGKAWLQGANAKELYHTHDSLTFVEHEPLAEITPLQFELCVTAHLPIVDQRPPRGIGSIYEMMVDNLATQRARLINAMKSAAFDDGYGQVHVVQQGGAAQAFPCSTRGKVIKWDKDRPLWHTYPHIEMIVAVDFSLAVTDQPPANIDWQELDMFDDVFDIVPLDAEAVKEATDRAVAMSLPGQRLQGSVYRHRLDAALEKGSTIVNTDEPKSLLVGFADLDEGVRYTVKAYEVC
jgi:hypothetical protein